MTSMGISLLFIEILSLIPLLFVRANNIPNAAESLDVPVAFPIFRPPQNNVQRPEERPMRFHSMSSSANMSANSTSGKGSNIEEISITETDSPSDEEPEGDEETREVSASTKMAPREEMPLVSTLFHNGETDTKRKGPMKMNKDRNGQDNQNREITSIWNSSPPPKTVGGLAGFSADPSTVVSFNRATNSPTNNSHSHGPNTINTPQFPVFTGLGMEIIDSNEQMHSKSTENDGSTVSMSSVTNGEHHKLHYQRTGIKEGNGGDMASIQLSTLQASTTERSLVADKNATNSHLEAHLSPIKIERITSSHVQISTTPLPIENTTRTGTVTTKPHTVLFGSTTTAGIPFDEVTEDLLAMFNHKNGQNTISSTIDPSSPSPADELGGIDEFHRVGLNGKDELDSGFERVTQIGGVEPEKEEETTPKSTMETTEQQQVLTRPTSRPRPVQSQDRMPVWKNTTTTENHTTPLIITQQSSKTASTSSSTSSPMFTRFPLWWTASVAQQNTAEFTTTSQSPTTHDWPMGNNIVEVEEGDEQQNNNIAGQRLTRPEQHKKKTTTTQSTEEQTTIMTEQSHHERGEMEEKKANKVENGISTSKFSSTVTNANFRLFIIGTVIIVLLITVLVGSICTGRYVRKSRQLHGKYRPAAYEMQTAQRGAFGRPSDFSQQVPVPIQQSTIINGREERLI